MLEYIAVALVCVIIYSAYLYWDYRRSEAMLKTQEEKIQYQGKMNPELGKFFYILFSIDYN